MSVKVESIILEKYLARSRREESRKDFTTLNAKFKYVEGGRIRVAKLLEKFRDLCPKANF
jgi:hypothetical protein